MADAAEISPRRLAANLACVMFYLIALILLALPVALLALLLLAWRHLPRWGRAVFA